MTCPNSTNGLHNYHILKGQVHYNTADIEQCCLCGHIRTIIDTTPERYREKEAQQ